MKLENTTTNRGFGLIKFKDANGIDCSLQESSAIRDESLIWFGCQSDTPVLELIPGKSWQPVKLPQDHLVRDRMHLTQSQVRALLPLLVHFAKHGQLPPPADT